MNKLWLSLLILILSTYWAMAQDPQDKTLSDLNKPLIILPEDTMRYWKVGGFYNLQFNQNFFVNWLPGGNNSTALNSILFTYANYAKKNIQWRNNLKLAYGFSRTVDNITKEVSVSKTDDQIEFHSDFLVKAFEKHWYWIVSLIAKTQFAPGFSQDDDSDIPTSRFAAPLYIYLGAGIAYSPDQFFNVGLMPAALKFTVVLDQRLADAGAYGVLNAVRDERGNIIVPGKNLRVQFGGMVTFYYLIEEIAENLSFQTNFWLFVSYFGTTRNVSTNWQGIFNLRLRKWLTASLNIQFFYDNQVGNIRVIDDLIQIERPRMQLKVVFTLNLQITF
ncbi:DUF3078 domain-containing protein [Xanthovirga aplysinae]|uniref:DUF3078 domain-containing protein n=1 Tax=Xanthovirga aplysinae TaxID=2529853 RepID=UPI0012BC6532|nr:DUF3078 domain-containing protein [Xanthovirga aplysinae]MTI32560.1 DUF3078 domain-containing protein [Xanthovirga aplysinae]